MSLILDALNRADQQRSEEQSSPSLRADYNPEPVHEQPIRRWVIEAVVIAVVILAAAGFLYYQPGSSIKNNVIQSITAETPAITVAPPVMPTITPQLATPLAKDIPLDRATSVATTQTKNSNPPNNANIQSLYSRRAQPPQAQESIQEQALPPKTTAPATTLTTTQTIAAKTNIKVVDKGLAILQNMPLLQQMPTRFQHAIPNIDYELHVYAESNSAGFVRLNGTMMKIGADIIPGLKVIAILPNSLVLDYRGTQFRLLALNSWVNFK